MKYYSWLVLETCGRKFLCQCDCGNKQYILKFDLKSGKSKMCRQCSNKTKKGKPNLANAKHGLCETPTWVSWVEMRRRCYSKHRKEYPNYGGRGIKVCDEWKNSFQTFVNDMGIRPNGHTLERIDNNSDYSPKNCKWIPRAEQELNKRSNVFIEVEGKIMCVAQAARFLNKAPSTIYSQLRRKFLLSNRKSDP